MQANTLRLTSALRVLTLGTGAQQCPGTNVATYVNPNGYACLRLHDVVPSTSASSYSELSGVRGMSTSTPGNNDDPTSQPSSAPGTETSRPTFAARLRDLLALSNWRISKGEASRLTEFKDGLAAATTSPAPASLEQGDASGQAAQAAAEAAAEALQTSGSTVADVHGGDNMQQLLQAKLEQQPQEQQEQQQSEQRLLHPKYGYAALGGTVPVDEALSTTSGLVGMLTSQHPRVNPRRRFMPGETYEPQDLNPFALRASGRTRPDVGAVRRPTAAEVMEKADYKNVAFLSRWFLSPAGRLLSRKQTRLPVAVHKYVSRQVKLARHMGLMAGEARLDKLHLARLRERELVEAQRKAATAAALVTAAVATGEGGAAAAGAEGAGGSAAVAIASVRAGSRLKALAELGG